MAHRGTDLGIGEKDIQAVDHMFLHMLVRVRWDLGRGRI